MVITLVVSLALCGAPKTDPRLVGAWFAGSEPFITLAANGTGTMEDDKVKWSVEGSTLIITDDEGDTERAAFKVNGDSLTLTIGGMAISLKRGGAGAKKAKAAKVKPEEEDDEEALAQAWLAQNGQGQPPRAQQGQQQGQRRAAGNDQLSQLLTSSAWCSFSFNKVSGASSQTRVQYFRNGTWSAGGQRETYNSGPNGTVAGQYNDQNGGLWEVRNGQLWGSYGNAPVQPVEFSVTRNSSGSPILNVLGVEYSMCN